MIFHWGTAVLFVVLLYLAWVMTELPLGPEKFNKYNLHKSLGLTILAIAALRLLWRRISPPPALPETMPRGQRRLAQLAHVGLYCGIFTQAAIGVLHSWTSGFPIVVYRTWTFPSPLTADAGSTALLANLHFFVGWSLVILIGVHAGAALYHHFIVKDDVLKRMLPGFKAGSSE